MTIRIGDTKPATPTIKLTGTRYNERTEVTTAYTSQDVSTKESLSGLTVSKASVLTFLGDVVVTFGTDGDSYTDAVYANTDTNYVGHSNMGADRKVNDEAQLYYTLNGKDPIRTKANLYYGQTITLKANKSGSDNTVIKVKKYAGGQWSDVGIAEVKIVRSNKNAV
ncbi:MAG: FN3 associated domain-containing protein [Clostridia bacterium]|jgi:hypothetical protein